MPGMTASMTTLSVIGVPIKTKTMDGLDSLLSIVQMPAGIPVATVAVNGAKNAGLLAISILATNDKNLEKKLAAYKNTLNKEVKIKGEKLSKSKQNYPDPWIIIEKYGMDTLSFYLMTSVVMDADNLLFNEREVSDIYIRVVNTLSNVTEFYQQYLG